MLTARCKNGERSERWRNPALFLNSHGGTENWKRTYIELSDSSSVCCTRFESHLGSDVLTRVLWSSFAALPQTDFAIVSQIGHGCYLTQISKFSVCNYPPSLSDSNLYGLQRVVKWTVNQLDVGTASAVPHSKRKVDRIICKFCYASQTLIVLSAKQNWNEANYTLIGTVTLLKSSWTCSVFTM